MVLVLHLRFRFLIAMFDVLGAPMLLFDVSHLAALAALEIAFGIARRDFTLGSRAQPVHRHRACGRTQSEQHEQRGAHHARIRMSKLGIVEPHVQYHRAAT